MEHEKINAGDQNQRECGEQQLNQVKKLKEKKTDIYSLNSVRSFNKI